MTEVKGKEGNDRPVTPAFTMAQGLIGVAAIRDYTRMRRENGLGEDAIVAYFYRELLRSLREAREEDPEAFDQASLLTQVPDLLNAHTETDDE